MTCDSIVSPVTIKRNTISSFTILEFSILDIIGAVIGLFYIVSEYRADRWLWPISLLMSLFYIIIDFSAGYFANGSICCYNFIMSIYGILVWRGLIKSKEKVDRPISSCPVSYVKWIVAAVAVLSLFLWWLLGFIGESNHPLIDGISAGLSIVGMWMLTQKWWQQWICWMLANPMMVVLFWLSGNYASAVLYIVFEVFCIMGIISWRRKSI